MSKRGKKWAKIGGGVVLAVGAVYFAAGVAYRQWEPSAWWDAHPEGNPGSKGGGAPGPGAFGQPGDSPSDMTPRWWSYFIGARSGGAFLAFNRR